MAVLEICRPEYKDLWFRQKMMADEETMSYNHAWGGTIPFPEEKWHEWYDHWLVHHENRRYYRYLKDEDGSFVGEMAYHYDEELAGYVADVIILSEYRGKGYGSMALGLLCTAAKENGITVLYDDIAIDNPAVKLFLKHGFKEESRTDKKIILKKEL
ncbi:MAG: GNAT family N-acetyltransferase [Solobacterium sp.]|nr:GNAT family N-acetyltransferase [Solobacterium sp.]